MTTAPVVLHDGVLAELHAGNMCAPPSLLPSPPLHASPSLSPLAQVRRRPITRALGGAGHVAGAFDGWPYHATSEGLRVYYQIQFGYHLHSGVVLVTAGWRRNDRTEMAVHNAAAVLLLLL